MKKGSTFALAFENKGRQTDKLSSSRRAKKSSLTDWNKVRNKTRQRGGRIHLRQIRICQDKRNVNSALCILRYMWSDEIKLNRKNGLREAWPDDRLFKYKIFYSEEFDPGSG